MSDQLFTWKGAVAASAVISKTPAKVKRLIVNSGAATATIQLFDDTTTTGPANPITGVITVPAGGVTNPYSIELDIMTTKGLVVMIAVAAANLTVIGNFSN